MGLVGGFVHVPFALNSLMAFKTVFIMLVSGQIHDYNDIDDDESNHNNNNDTLIICSSVIVYICLSVVGYMIIMRVMM